MKLEKEESKNLENIKVKFKREYKKRRKNKEKKGKEKRIYIGR